MKKILIFIFLIASLMAISYHVEAQGAPFTGTTTNPKDSVIDTGIDTTSYHLTKGYDNLLIWSKLTRGSGTIAGTSILEWSGDGATGSWKSDVGDTLTLSNAATLYIYWQKSNKVARYWRIRTGGGTTVRYKFAAKVQTD